MAASQQLVKYDAMCHAIDQAYRVDEVKDLRDKAMALEAYAKQAKNVEAERRACEIRLRAERKAGQLLKTMAKSKERAGGKGGDRRSSHAAQLERLPDLGISKNQSSRWQQLADVPDEKFEQALAADDKPTTNGIITTHAPPPIIEPVSRAALFICGRLRDFERDGYLDMAPADVLTTMTPAMRADVVRLAPMVAIFLNRLAKEAH